MQIKLIFIWKVLHEDSFSNKVIDRESYQTWNDDLRIDYLVQITELFTVFRLLVLWNDSFFTTPPFSLEYRASLYTRLEAKRLRPTEEYKAKRPSSDSDSTDGDSDKQVMWRDNTCHAKRFWVYVMTPWNVYKCEQLVRCMNVTNFFPSHIYDLPLYWLR